MNCQEFNQYWTNNYPESLPMGFDLKNYYTDRWFRIHSLPKSKRYADNDSEYQIILERQNQLITDLIGENVEIILSFGNFSTSLDANDKMEFTEYGEFKKCKIIELHKVKPNEYDEPSYYSVYMKLDIWKSNSKNDLLKDIADDAARVMLISPIKKLAFVPYDGGMDIILETQAQRDVFKAKYKDWLSSREDGL